ncbi:MAG: MarR family winged helix-turn-helix transcriptional regulator [Candidatus Micrarchaeota archaeon]
MITPIFFKEKPLKALVSLSQKDRVWYPSMIAKEIDCTYPHISNIMTVFESEGLIETEEQGRIKIVKLTSKGEDLAQDFETVLRRINKQEKQKK